MQNAPAAPDPQGLAAALQLLSNPNLFRDITGLEANQRNALQALQSSLQAAQQFGAEAADVAKTFGQYATSLGMQSATSQDMDRIQRSIQTARGQGLISDDQASELTHSALSAMVGQGVATGGADPRATEAVLGTIRSARERGDIDDEQAREATGRSIAKLANDGETPREPVVDRPLASRALSEAPDGASVEISDGNTRIVRSGGQAGTGRPPGTTAEHIWYEENPSPGVRFPGIQFCSGISR